jgi:hypothetical protein
MKEFVHTKLNSGFAVRFIILVLVVNVFINHRWTRGGLISGDTFSYYTYLPSFFIRHDVTLGFLDTDKETPFNNLWFSTSDLGIRFTKMSIGWALMNLPFFLLAHAGAILFNFNADGFSMPYGFAICMTTLFYVSAALVLLRKLLLKYFSEIAASLTLLAIVFATNLYHYTVFEPAMTHPLSFFLFAAFLWMTVKWYHNITVKNSLILGLITGLIVLTRATNILIVLVFILYNVTGWRTLKEKFKLLKSHFTLLMLIPIAAFIVTIPQLLYWKLVSGHFIFYSYTDEHFFFLHPHILDGLIGFRKGWLLYTPVMIFALIGLFLKTKRKEWSLASTMFTIVNIFIILSWWCWWYGGSFGGRSFIESYALLSIPLAGFFNYASLKRSVLKLTCILTLFFIFLNLYQTIQYKHGVIHYDSMTGSAYAAVFLKDRKPDNFSFLICHPDYYNAKLGIPERRDCVLHDHNNP